MEFTLTDFANIKLRKVKISRNNYFLNRVKSSTFLSLILVGGHELPKSVANHEGRRAGQGGIGRQGKGEPEWLATLFGNEWLPTIMRERIVLLLRGKDAVFLEI